jgi:hypothetical protein
MPYVPGPNVPPPVGEPKPWTRPAWEDAKEILERVKELDRKLDQPDCDEVPKQEWMDEIERRLDEIEKNTSP